MSLVSVPVPAPFNAVSINPKKVLSVQPNPDVTQGGSVISLAATRTVTAPSWSPAQTATNLGDLVHLQKVTTAGPADLYVNPALVMEVVSNPSSPTNCFVIVEGVSFPVVGSQAAIAALF